MKKYPFDLIQKYTDGWKQNDLAMITSCLTPSCTVIESHGPTYHGISAMELWFEHWMAAKSKIKKWDITSFYICDPENTAVVEWDFACVSNEIDYSFQGISLYKTIEQKIAFIHEYRMSRPAYVWEGKELASE